MLEEFIDLLVRLIVDGIITEQQALELIDEFVRTGELPPLWQLPLSLTQAILDLEPEILRMAGSGKGDERDTERLQTEFMLTVSALSQMFGDKQLTLKQWQSEVRDELIGYLAAMALNGAGRSIQGEDAEEVLEIMRVQMAYLSRFADTIGAGDLSTAQVSERAKLYAGEGRALYYQQAEKKDTDLPGYVVDYLAVDDRVTCGPCRQAEEGGPYLPGEGPFPGRVCLGRGNCRCRRAVRFDMQTYLRLTQ